MGHVKNDAKEGYYDICIIVLTLTDNNASVFVYQYGSMWHVLFALKWMDRRKLVEPEPLDAF